MKALEAGETGSPEMLGESYQELTFACDCGLLSRAGTWHVLGHEGLVTV